MSAKNELLLTGSTGSPKTFDPRRYQPTLPRLPETVRHIFEDYFLIPEVSILYHIYQVREKAWKMYIASTFQIVKHINESHIELRSLPYICIEVFRFRKLGANLSFIYPEIFLDLGCCFGENIRKLVSERAPSENIIGADKEAQIIELGYELFLNRETLKSHFYRPASLTMTSLSTGMAGWISFTSAHCFHFFDFDGRKQ